ncbi:hypothetical protein [Butyrivibrio sp. AE2032]|uniref:hypothetical protein n=1 Tax=Butyrivibrio sp. AE2032 TaxID=1458463 RepID=UPI0005517695|nr:hypothetical protein [Butyrivibrio sp. AE2032]
MRNHIVLSLGEILKSGEYNEEKILSSFSRFRCPQEHDLEDFLVKNAISYELRNIGKTYLFINKASLDDGEFVVDAYVTLATKAIDISEMSGKGRRKMLGNYPGRDELKTISAFLIGQLGRADYCDKKELTGEDLLNMCYSIFKQASSLIGGAVVVLECREHMYEKFYEKHGFKKIRDSLNSDNLYELYKKVNFDD